MRTIDAAVRFDIGGLFLRVLPRAASLSLGGALVLRTRVARVELRGRHALRQATRYDSAPAAGGTVSLTAAALVGCCAPRWRWIELPVCADVEAGAKRGRSFGVIDDGDAWAPLGAVPLEISLIASPIPRVGLVATAGVSPSLLRPSFHVRGLEPLFVAGPVALRLSAGVEVRFP